ncbi:DciA family protein [Kitasatospora azatica]|uniref:DciA family protein n=1 Tax=Kitasatospora azatica TaxID=58347 RepID=UPI00068C03FD|nr:DciA family protein [Kitasatospora azatica]
MTDGSRFAQEPGGADLARTALRTARRTARLNGNVPLRKTAPTRQQIARAGRDAREPSTLAAVVPAMAAAQGWALGTAQGSMRNNWAQLVGAEEALHWFPAGFTADTRTLRITCDSPAWATKLRLEQRQLLAKLNGARPDTVRAIEIRVGAATASPTPDTEPDTRPGRPREDQAPAPATRPLADSAAYQQLRRQMHEQARIREAMLEEAAEKEEIIRRNSTLREPEGAHRSAVEDELAAAEVAHARRNRDSHRAALAVARGYAVPLRAARSQQSAVLTGAA